MNDEHGHGGVACPECGHSDRMHVTGTSPKYAGCMERVPRDNGRLRTCWCALTPVRIAQALDDIEAQEPGNFV
jgi:hypothetical protein